MVSRLVAWWCGGRGALDAALAVVVVGGGVVSCVDVDIPVGEYARSLS
jgi:hypothetical protein